MNGSLDNVGLYGTSEPTADLNAVTIGDLSFLQSQESIRRITWRGTELVRAITWPIRDEDWGTYQQEILAESSESSDGSYTYSLRFSVGDGRLECDLSVKADQSGTIRADITMTPTQGAFPTNRAGFTVLHPIQNVAGADLQVRHSDGSVEDTKFPELISPGQPVMDISGLSHAIGDASVDIRFSGEVFEMEDQRNWSDASYKTYCVPLVYPFVYPIEGPTTQTIEITLQGGTSTSDSVGGDEPTIVSADMRIAPDMGLAVDPDWIGQANARQAVATCGASYLLLRVRPDSTAEYLAAAAALADQLEIGIDVEIVLPDDQPAEAALRSVAASLQAQGIVPVRVIGLPEGYLGSHQPSGPWPEGTTPSEAVHLTRAAFPNAATGGGMLTNFTELNRCRPIADDCDYLTHSGTAIVHAGDDLSVLETLETLPQIYRSTEAIGQNKPYRLGLMTIGMRSNPYGNAVAENPTQIRRTMGHIDPRHRGLFGAAWAVGVLESTENSLVQSLCLAAPTGPFGLAFEPRDWPQEGFDGDDTARVYPLFHVFRAAASMSGEMRLTFESLPKGVAAYGISNGSGPRMMIANVTAEPVTVQLQRSFPFAILDSASLPQAKADPNWLSTAARTDTNTLHLGPFAIAFGGQTT